MILDYARVSTEDQHLKAQLAALKAAGPGRVFAENISGTAQPVPNSSGWLTSSVRRHGGCYRCMPELARLFRVSRDTIRRA